MTEDIRPILPRIIALALPLAGTLGQSLYPWTSSVFPSVKWRQQHSAAPELGEVMRCGLGVAGLYSARTGVGVGKQPRVLWALWLSLQPVSSFRRREVNGQPIRSFPAGHVCAGLHTSRMHVHACAHTHTSSPLTNTLGPADFGYWIFIANRTSEV